MDMLLYLGARTPSGYREVSRSTFTYGILATLPLFVMYHVGLLIVNEGNAGPWVLNVVHGTIQKLLVSVGLPAESAAALIMIILAMLWRYERRRFMVAISPFFFVKTFIEAAFSAALIGLGALLLVKAGLYHPELFLHKGSAFNDGILLSKITDACGAGFYEGIFIASLIQLLVLYVEKMNPRLPKFLIGIVVAASVFPLMHYNMSVLSGIPLDTQIFAYKMSLGLIFSTLYVWRGFATMAWTHVLFDFWIFSWVL